MSGLKNRAARRPGPLQVRPAPAKRWSRLRLRSGAGPGQGRAGQAKGEPRRGPGTCDRNGFEIACRERSRFSSFFAPTIGGNWHPSQRTAHLLSWCALFHHRSFDKTKTIQLVRLLSTFSYPLKTLYYWPQIQHFLISSSKYITQRPSSPAAIRHRANQPCCPTTEG